MKIPKLSKQLFQWMSLLLIIFSMLVFAMFWPLFRYALVDTYQRELQTKANQIASAIENVRPSQGHMGGLNMYLRFLYESTNEDVWIIDTNYQIETRLTSHYQQFEDLPFEVQQYVEKIFNNQQPKVSILDTLFNPHTLLAGTQLMNANQDVIGVVLVHMPMEAMAFANTATYIVLFVSLVIGLLLSFFVTSWLSKRLSKPLESMIGFVEALSFDQQPEMLNVETNQEMIRLNESLARLATRLQMSTLERQRMTQLQKQFIASVSHELKTPITILQGYIEAFEDNVIKEKDVNQSIDSMHEQVQLLHRLIIDLLEITRLDNPEFVLNMEEYEITFILNRVIENYKNLAQKKDINFDVSVKHSFTSLVDYDRIQQLFGIIISNAIKFSDKGSHITISQNANNRKIIQVCDQGPGIAEDEIEDIMIHFYKAKSNHQEGSGLGLAIAKKIADRHHIQLKLENNNPKGLCVSFIFGEEKL